MTVKTIWATLGDGTQHAYWRVSAPDGRAGDVSKWDCTEAQAIALMDAQFAHQDAQDLCPKCLQPIRVGDFPFCPHGGSRLTVVSDGVPGGFVVENGFDRPTRFDSKSAHEQALAARGLEVRAKWAGPDDRHLTRWDTVDLDAAKTLLERGPAAIRERNADRWPRADVPITVTVGGVIQRKDLE